MKRTSLLVLDLSHCRGELLALLACNGNDAITDRRQLSRDPETQAPSTTSYDDVKNQVEPISQKP